MSNMKCHFCGDNKPPLAKALLNTGRRVDICLNHNGSSDRLYWMCNALNNNVWYMPIGGQAKPDISEIGIFGLFNYPVESEEG
jgi:hypothetical protein